MAKQDTLGANKDADLERYSYKRDRKYLFTEAGQVDFLKVRDHVHKILKKSGAITMGRATDPITGVNYEQWACVDRLVELGEIIEIVPVKKLFYNERVFIPGIRVSDRKD